MRSSGMRRSQMLHGGVHAPLRRPAHVPVARSAHVPTSHNGRTMMNSDQIRETFLEFFAAHGHLRLPSASLVPPPTDTSTLTTIAGMQPLKPYFLGRERPPAPRLASCQKVLRTVDLDLVGTTARHLTFFEMLGNFSIGDYFKQEAIEFAWALSREGFGFPAE